MKKVLLVGDIVGVGKIALSTMIPILSNMKLSVNNLPTALVSNTFDYLNVEMIDLTSYMENSIEVWKDLGFRFDIIVTGFMTGKDQVSALKKLISYHENRPFIITDPIMGDDGTLYYGLEDDIIDTMIDMVGIADLIIPNATEAALLLGEDYDGSMDDNTARNWLKRLSEKGVGSIVLTSVRIDEINYVYGYDRKKDSIFNVEYKYVPYKFAGTGDIFTSILTGMLAYGEGLEEAVKKTTSMITEILEQESINPDEVRDVQIENYLHLIR